MKVEIYHECLGGTACGDGPKFKPLDPIGIDLDVNQINFLTNSDAGKESLEKQLKTCYAEVLKWPVRKSGTIKIKCTLTADLTDCRKIVKTWEEEVPVKCETKRNLPKQNETKYSGTCIIRHLSFPTSCDIRQKCMVPK